MEWICPCKSFYSTEAERSHKQSMQNCQCSVADAEESAHFHFGGKFRCKFPKRQPRSSRIFMACGWILFIYPRSWWGTSMDSSYFATLFLNIVWQFDWEQPLYGFLSLSNHVFPFSALYENRTPCIWAFSLLRGRNQLIWSSRHMERNGLNVLLFTKLIHHPEESIGLNPLYLERDTSAVRNTYGIKDNSNRWLLTLIVRRFHPGYCLF